jgi:beta-lactamase regulating signal transducer with metallopeptidase domain
MATGMALAVAILHRFWRRPAVIHSLWIVVLLKLITPPLVAIPVPQFASSWPGPVHSETNPAAIEAEQIPPKLVASSSRQPVSESAASALAVFDSESPDMRNEKAKEAPTSSLSDIAPFPTGESPAELQPEVVAGTAALPWTMWLVIVWLIGSVSWLLLVACRVYRFRALIPLASVASAELRAQVRGLAERLGLRSAPEVALIPGRLPPLVWALGARPRLFVPITLWRDLNAEQQAALVAHELAHLKRGDHWVRYLELMVTAIYWWHPIVWWACRKLREAEEECCDAWVVWALPAATNAYAAALVATVDFLSEMKPALPVAASGVSQVSDLRRRLVMIMHGKTPRMLSGSSLAVVLVTAVCLLPLVPSWAGQTRPDNQATDQKRLDSSDPAVQAFSKVVQENTAQAAERLADVLFAQAGQQPEKPDQPDQGRAEAELNRARAELNQAQAQMRAYEEQLRQMEHQLREASRRFEEAKRRTEEQRHRVAERVAQMEQRQHRAAGDTSSIGRGEGAAGGRFGRVQSEDQGRRISEIERKLDEVMDELRRLRREMRSPRRSEGGEDLPARPGARGAREPGEAPRRRGSEPPEPPSPPDQPKDGDSLSPPASASTPMPHPVPRAALPVPSKPTNSAPTPDVAPVPPARR